MADSAVKIVYPETIWAGTEHSFDIAVQAHAMIMAAGSSMPEDEEEEPYNFSVQGEVGVIEIKGSLTNRDSVWNRYYGVTSYGEIRKALVYAAQQADVKAILLDIDSGGGAVNGVSDTGDLISMVDRNIKPVYAMTDGTMASAAYWLGASARQVYAAKTSLVGSIGVISTHAEYSKALKEAGINVTVLRAGEYKALVNSVEPLTKVAIEQAMERLNTAYDIFIGHVAASRNVTVDKADSVMGQGREFMGEAAVGAGLIDGISNFEGMLAKINASLDSTRMTQSQYGRHIQSATMKTALTPEQIAAAQAGVTMPPAQTGASSQEGATTATTETTAETQPANNQAATGTAAPAADQSAVIALLQSQLDAANKTTVDLRVELAQATAKVEAMTSAQVGLKTIVAGSLSTMRVALGMSKTDLSAMTAETLIAEHAATSKTFTDSFKVGGVAASGAAEATKTETGAGQPLPAHVLAATRVTPFKP